MIAIQQFDDSSPEDYLEAEKSSPIKHEYHDGDLYAMVGATDEHVTIGMNIAFLLRQHLQGSDCRSYVFDMKVRNDAVNYFYYPDVMVSCDPRDQGFRFFKKYPVLILEVLSESTERSP